METLAGGVNEVGNAILLKHGEDVGNLFKWQKNPLTTHTKAYI